MSNNNILLSTKIYDWLYGRTIYAINKTLDFENKIDSINYTITKDKETEKISISGSFVPEYGELIKFPSTIDIYITKYNRKNYLCQKYIVGATNIDTKDGINYTFTANKITEWEIG